MSSVGITVIGTAIVSLLLAGYIGQKYLPPPKPRIVGIDLGTTYSCIGAYHAVSGQVDIFANSKGQLCIPSVVAYREDGKVLVGTEAVAQADHNPLNTFYDAKRFIGKIFTSEEILKEAHRYPFKIFLDAENTKVKFIISHNLQHPPSSTDPSVTPEQIASEIIKELKKAAEAHLQSTVNLAVISVPAEFNTAQREATVAAAQLAGIEVLRVINEPTAAALAYGLHNKNGVQDVLVIDLGGGTLDVSLLDIQGGMFLTRAMAGNNHLGGQDFNERLKDHLLQHIQQRFQQTLTHPEDLQLLRSSVEMIKLQLTSEHSAVVNIQLNSLNNKNNSNNNNDESQSPSSNDNVTNFRIEITRDTFEHVNRDLFDKVLEPIRLVLEEGELEVREVEDVVMVGGSTRIPMIRKIVSDFFEGKKLNVDIDPELAVITGVSTQAGIVGGAWPLRVSAVEMPCVVKKVYVG